MSSEEMQGAVLRITFVEMLFALAVAQVGVQSAQIAGIQSDGQLAAVFHLLLGLLVIAASWFGWQRSAVRSSKQEVERLFSVQFLGFLLDAVLVVLYFILVQEVDVRRLDGGGTVVLVSARPEALWLVVVFIVYILWDLVTDVLSPETIAKASSISKRLFIATRVALACTSCSVVCALLSAGVLLVARHDESTLSVVLFDVALIATVLMFRALKPVLEPRVARWLGVQDCPAVNMERPVNGHEGSWVGGLLIVYGLSVALAVGICG